MNLSSGFLKENSYFTKPYEMRMIFLTLYYFCLVSATNTDHWLAIDKEIFNSGIEYKVKQSSYAYQVNFGAKFPVEVGAANNNVGIEIFEDRLYLGQVYMTMTLTNSECVKKIVLNPIKVLGRHRLTLRQMKQK